MDAFTPVPALAGGMLIGLAAAALLAFDGKIAGVSGIAGGLLSPVRGDVLWRAAFVGGLVTGGLVLRTVLPAAFDPAGDASLALHVAAGTLVGIGTRLGSGCTSGHGVCGIGRGSPRSLVATVVFMAAGVATVFVVRHVVGGG